MKFFLAALTAFFALFASAQTSAQQSQPPSITPGSAEIDRTYLVPRQVFQRLSWIDAGGKLTGTATLNCVTRVDTAGKTLTYLQLRNDGKRDSTVAEWPDLKPIYTSSAGGGYRVSYDYHSGKDVKVNSTVNGKIVADSTATLSPASFDSFLTDYLFGALPLKPGYTANFSVNSGSTTIIRIKEVMTDVLLSPNGQPIEVYILPVEFGPYKVLYWIDKSTREMLKSVVRSKDGSIFMKSRI